MCLVAETLGATLTSYATKQEGQKEVANSSVRLELCGLERTYSPTMASCERPWNDLGGPSGDPERCTSND
jgi:hypothetical protein